MNLKFFFVVITVMVCGRVAGQESAYGKFDKEEMLDSKFPTVGAYLWCDFGRYKNEIFFDFAKMNGVSEIYLALREIDYEGFDFLEKTKYFMEMAHKRNLKVYRLLGSQRKKIEDLRSDIKNIDKAIQQTISYNEKVPDSLKFAGIHLDIEFVDIKNDAKFQVLSDCAVRFREQYGDQLPIDFSIVKYDSIVMYKGKPTALYKAIIDEANRTFIQESYRKERADLIYKSAEPFIEYAATKGKTIIYTVQPKDFQGYLPMNRQLRLLYDMTEYKNTGLAIHTLNNWFSRADHEN